MHPAANLLSDSALTPRCACPIAFCITKELNNCHEMTKIQLIFKEILERIPPKTGQDAQFGTWGSPDDAVSSGNIERIAASARAVAVWLRDCTERGCMHGVVPQCRTSPSAVDSRRCISGGILGRRERIFAVPVLRGSRSAGISGVLAVVDHARGQS